MNKSRWIFFVVLTFVTLFVRFFKIEDIGLLGSDGILYWNFSKYWAEGDFLTQIGCGKNVYRPVVFFLYALANKLFDGSLWSLQVLNAFLDSLCVFFVFALAKKISGRFLVASASALVYALGPSFVAYARSELVHSLSTFMVLASTLLFLQAWRGRKFWVQIIYFIFSGSLFALTVPVHEDLVAVTGALFLCFLLERMQKRCLFKKGTLVTAFVFIGSFSGVLLLFDLGQIFGSHTKRVTLSPAGEKDLFAFWFDSFHSMLSSNSSLLFELTFFLSLLLSFVFIFKKKTKHPEQQKAFHHIGAIIPIVYCTLYSLAVGNLYPRLFLPLMPFAIIHVFHWSDFFLRNFRIQKLYHCAFGSLVLCLLAANLFYPHQEALFKKHKKNYYNSLPKSLPRIYQEKIFGSGSKIHPAKVIFDKLQDKVHDKSRLLVAPLSFYPWSGRRVLQAYFGDNAQYLIDAESSLDDFIAEHSIRYLAFMEISWDERIHEIDWQCQYLGERRWQKRENFVAGGLFGWERGEYSEEKEWEFLKEKLGFTETQKILGDRKKEGFIVIDLMAPSKKL